MTQTTKAATGRRAAVYRLYDAAGTLLYIGSAYDPEKRCKRHRGKPWWPLVARREDEWHPSREVAFSMETDAIEAERPAFNRISGPGAVALPAPRPRLAVVPPELEQVDAYIASLRDESPMVRARALTELLETVTQVVRPRRRAALVVMKEGGMTYREIAAKTDLSFGRVRQILTAE